MSESTVKTFKLIQEMPSEYKKALFMLSNNERVHNNGKQVKQVDVLKLVIEEAMEKRGLEMPEPFYLESLSNS